MILKTNCRKFMSHLCKPHTAPIVGVIFLVSLVCHQSAAQKFLVLEKAGSKKRHQYFVGDEIAYKIKGEKGVRRDIITNLLANAVMFDRGYITIQEIEYVVIKKHWGIVSTDGGGKLMIAGAALFLLNLMNTQSPGIDPKSLSAPGALIVLGGIILAASSKKFRPGRKRKIKMLNIED